MKGSWRRPAQFMLAGVIEHRGHFAGLIQSAIAFTTSSSIPK